MRLEVKWTKFLLPIRDLHYCPYCTWKSQDKYWMHTTYPSNWNIKHIILLILSFVAEFVLSPFHIWRNWGSERLINSPSYPQQVSRGTKALEHKVSLSHNTVQPPHPAFGFSTSHLLEHCTHRLTCFESWWSHGDTPDLHWVCCALRET